ncbi:S41 family peptidase [Mariniphaga sp.]|uniref:S41 family peptidase n=1 Tax=Mariniphaga sp. TaxID=1954475 RepID=UPI0035657883
MRKKLYTLLGISLFAIVFTGCEKLFVEEPANNPVAVFENLWTTFNEEYAPFEERNVNWETEYANFRSMVTEQTTDDELFDVLSQLLATLDDGHVSLTAPGKNIFFSNKIRQEKIEDELFDLSVIKNNYLENEFKEGDETSYIYGKVKNENIGYIFFDHVGENFFKLNEFLTEFETADGLIFDFRHNQGGDFTYCFSEMGRLTDEKRFVFQSKTKNGKGKNDYTEWQKWFIEPAGNFIEKPIIVLTDRYTISAGERSVMAFKTLPNVTLMGDTTNGAHGTMIGRELANGWFYSLVPQKVELYDGKTYEGIGLAPDILVKNQWSEIESGTDKTLQTAIEFLK